MKHTKQLSFFKILTSTVEDKKNKRCPKCKIVKPLEHFPWQSAEQKFRRANCKDCDKQLNKVRVKLKSIHGSPPKNYKCPICLGTEKNLGLKGGKNGGIWCLDHDHDTDKFRGWLCHLCNRAIGFLKDDISNLERAIGYLKKHEEKNKNT